jgi:predicted DNA-binding transcriptional regulator AlpA
MARKKELKAVDLFTAPEYASLPTIANALGVTQPKLKSMIRGTNFPAPTMFPSGTARYDVEAVRVWVRENCVRFATDREPVTDPECFVYFIGCGGFVKIGHSTDVTYRLSQLQVASPHEMQLISSYVGGPSEERRLHKLFAEHRVRENNEWFVMSDEILAYIEATKNADAK